MAHKWTGIGTLSRVGGNDIQPGEEFEPTDAELESFAARIEDIEEDTPDETEDASADAESGTQTPDESAEDTPLEDKEYSELRDMAMDADTDEINGRSSKDEIIAYFED